MLRCCWASHASPHPSAAHRLLIHRLLIPCGVAALLLGTLPIVASILGVNSPPQPITRATIDRLPSRQRSVWLAYLQRSQRKRQADKDFFTAELKRSGLAAPLEPPHGYSARSIPLDRAHSWYAGAEARHIADVIVSFQTPAGGWGKNMDMSGDLRRPGERFAPNNLSHFLAPGDFDTPREPDWNYVGTIDNDATTTELQYLAKIVTAIGPQSSEPYRAAILHGIQYLLDAQFPNGGWPQVWPLEGNYHDAITFNDDAIIETIELLRDTSDGQGDFAFVPKDVRDRAASSVARGIQCILDTQIRSHGVLTVWPQQAAPLTLAPESGRNFEPPAESASESADILLLLMNDLPHPNAAEQQSIRAAAAWFRKTAIYGEQWERTPNGRELVPTPGAGPTWARYYQIGTDRPIFADRDKSIHDNVADLSLERRNGYAWYSPASRKALDRFAQWSKEHPESL